MDLKIDEYRQKIHIFSKPTLLIMSNILGAASNEEQIAKMHKIIIETENEEDTACNLSKLLDTMLELD